MHAEPDDWDLDERTAAGALADDLRALTQRHRAELTPAVLRAAGHGVLPPDLEERAVAARDASAWNRTLVESLEASAPELSPADVARLLARSTGATTVVRRSDLGWRAGGSFLALAAAVLLFVNLPHWRTVTPPLPSSAAAAARGDVTLAPPAPPAFVIPLVKPPFAVSLRALRWRGAETADNPLLADLKPVLEAYEHDDFAAAARALEPLTARYPESVEVFLHLGLAQLFLDQPAAAVSSLVTAARVADADLRGEASWFLAVAHERAGNPTSAARQLTTVCNTGHARAADACAALRQLR